MPKYLLALPLVAVLGLTFPVYQWVKKIDERTAMTFDYLSAPVAKEADGKTISRADLLHRVMVAAVKEEVARINAEKQKNGEPLPLQAPPGGSASVPGRR